MPWFWSIKFNVLSTSQGYFIPRIEGIAFIVHLYLHSLCRCFLRFFFCTRLYHIKYSYLIQIICKQINLTHRWDPNRCYPSETEWARELMATKGYSVFPSLVSYQRQRCSCFWQTITSKLSFSSNTYGQSLSSSCTASTDFLDSLLPFVPITHRFQ